MTNPVNNGENVVVRDEHGRIVSGQLNPAGKPKGARHLSTLLLDAIKRVSDDKGTSEDVEIVKALIKKAKDGDTKAIDIVFDRIEGKAPQSIDITTDGDKISGSATELGELARRMSQEIKETYAKRSISKEAS